MSNLAIGFSNKYYTLWEMTSRVNQTVWGFETRRYYSFKKLLGKNLDKIKAAYPGVEINEKLNGRRRTFEEFDKRVFTSPDYFKFGKYSRTRIDECEDLGYLEWYIEQITDDKEHLDVVTRYLESNGYEISWCGKCIYLLNPTEVKKRNLVKDKYSVIMKKLENNEPINIAPDRNLNHNGEYINSAMEITYKFNNFTTNYWNGCFYCLPTINGKGKRIKFKNVTITKYTYNTNEDGSLTINVDEFTVKGKNKK